MADERGGRPVARRQPQRGRRRPTRRVQGSLQRSLAALTIGTVKAREERDAMLEPISGSNMIQYRQIPVAGKVSEKPVHAEVNVDWPYPIVAAPAQTDSDQERPHFALGVELLSTEPVMIFATVIGWIDADDGWTEGARLRITAWIPRARKKHDFSAILHLTFSGYGIPTEDDPSESEPE